jgi:hypothetical protein
MKKDHVAKQQVATFIVLRTTLWSGVCFYAAELMFQTNHYTAGWIFAASGVAFLGQGIYWFRKYVCDHK